MHNYKPVTLVRDYSSLPEASPYHEFQKDWRPIDLPNIYVLYSKTRDYVVVLDGNIERVAVMPMSPKAFNLYVRQNKTLPDMGIWFTNLNGDWTMEDIVTLVNESQEKGSNANNRINIKRR